MKITLWIGLHMAMEETMNRLNPTIKMVWKETFKKQKRKMAINKLISRRRITLSKMVCPTNQSTNTLNRLLETVCFTILGLQLKPKRKKNMIMAYLLIGRETLAIAVRVQLVQNTVQVRTTVLLRMYPKEERFMHSDQWLLLTSKLIQGIFLERIAPWSSWSQLYLCHCAN